MRLASRLLLAIAPVVLAGCATVDPGPTTTVYSNVSFNGDTGDAGGYEIEFGHDGGKATVLLVVCEGGCWGGAVSSVVVDDDMISFSVTETWLDQDGRVAERPTIRYRAKLAPDHVRLTSPDRPELAEKLMRVRNPRPGSTADLANFG